MTTSAAEKIVENWHLTELEEAGILGAL